MSNFRLLEMTNTGKRKSFPEITFPESNAETGQKLTLNKKTQNFWTLD